MENQNYSLVQKELNDSMMQNNYKHNRGLRKLVVRSLSIIFQKRMIAVDQLLELQIQSYYNNDLSLQIDHYASVSLTMPKIEDYLKSQIMKILHVLFASNILQESQGLIYYNDQVFSKNNGCMGNHSIKREEIIDTKQKLKIELARKRRENAKKLTKLTDLKNKINNVKGLLAKNKIENRSKFIKFPFLMVIPSSEPDSHLSIEMEKNDKTLILESNMQMSLLSDQEALNILDDMKFYKPNSQKEQKNSPTRIEQRSSEEEQKNTPTRIEQQNLHEEQKISPIRIEYAKKSVTQKLSMYPEKVSQQGWLGEVSKFDSSTNDKSIYGNLSIFENLTEMDFCDDN